MIRRHLYDNVTDSEVKFFVDEYGFEDNLVLRRAIAWGRNAFDSWDFMYTGNQADIIDAYLEGFKAGGQL